MSNKLIPKLQWAGNIYYNPLAKHTEQLGQQAKKELDQYKDTEAFLKNLYQDYYKEHMHDAYPLSFEHWVNRETGNSPKSTVGPSKSVEPSLWDKVIHAGEYGDSGNGPSIYNVVNSPVGTVLSFTPLGFAAQAAVSLPSKEGVRKTINDVKNRDYLDAVGSGLMDAIDMTGVGHGVKKAAKAGLLGKGLATSLAIDDAVKTGVTYAPDGTLLFTNPSFNAGNVLRRVTSPQEALNTSMIGTWTDPLVMTKLGFKPFDREARTFKEGMVLNIKLRKDDILDGLRFTKAPGHNHGVFGSYLNGTFYPTESITPNSSGVLELPITTDNFIRTGSGNRYTSLVPLQEGKRTPTAYRWADFYHPKVSTNIDGGLYYQRHPSELGWSVSPVSDQSSHYLYNDGRTLRQKYLKEFGKTHLTPSKELETIVPKNFDEDLDDLFAPSIENYKDSEGFYGLRYIDPLEDSSYEGLKGLEASIKKESPTINIKYNSQEALNELLNHKIEGYTIKGNPNDIYDVAIQNDEYKMFPGIQLLSDKVDNFHKQTIENINKYYNSNIPYTPINTFLGMTTKPKVGGFHPGNSIAVVSPKNKKFLQETESTMAHEAIHDTEKYLTPEDLNKYRLLPSEPIVLEDSGQMLMLSPLSGKATLIGNSTPQFSPYSKNWLQPNEMRATIQEHRFAHPELPSLQEFSEVPDIGLYNGYGRTYDDFKVWLKDALKDYPNDYNRLLKRMEDNLKSMGKLPVVLPAVTGSSYILNKEKDSSDFIK